jgi:hypothetical protein
MRYNMHFVRVINGYSLRRDLKNQLLVYVSAYTTMFNFSIISSYI